MKYSLNGEENAFLWFKSERECVESHNQACPKKTSSPLRHITWKHQCPSQLMLLFLHWASPVGTYFPATKNVFPQNSFTSQNMPFAYSKHISLTWNTHSLYLENSMSSSEVFRFTKKSFRSLSTLNRIVIYSIE